MSALNTGAKSRLTRFDLTRFTTDTLFDRLARAVCEAECLPRKELYEAWELARRVRRLFRGGRIVDLGSGHGLLAHVMLLLDDSSPCAIAVDKVHPPAHERLHAVLSCEWPRLAGRVTFVTSELDEVGIHTGDVVVSSHACGVLTDVVLRVAARARARVAVLPCCHDFSVCDDGGLTGWVDTALAIDIRRVRRLEEEGYQVWPRTIPLAITPKNRLLIAAPR
jgi:hypothetical protein